MIYFTGDTHLWHRQILNFESRPFSSVEEMTHKMIEGWNQQVKDEDYIYHLGDVSLGDFEKTREVFRQLKGRKNQIHHSF